MAFPPLVTWVIMTTCGEVCYKLDSVLSTLCVLSCVVTPASLVRHYYYLGFEDKKLQTQVKWAAQSAQLLSAKIVSCTCLVPPVLNARVSLGPNLGCLPCMDPIPGSGWGTRDRLPTWLPHGEVKGLTHVEPVGFKISKTSFFPSKSYN